MKWLFRIVQYLLLLLLPFFLLVRLSVWLYSACHLNPWMSVAGGGVAVIMLLILYFTLVYGRFAGKLGSWRAFKRRAYLAGFLVWGFCVYALVFLSGENVKDDAVQSEFLSLHPVLRLAVSTLVLADRDLIVTDAARHPDDYRRMGLPSKSRSLHFGQSSGFVHAVDVRTNGRSNFRNGLIRTVFRLMGFNTLRHVGTADHLHISIASRDLPGAI